MVHILVDGVGTKDKHQQTHAKIYKKQRGLEDLQLVINRSQTRAVDVSLALAGLFSDRFGVPAEKEATKTLTKKILQGIRRDEVVEITAFSQGTIITRNSIQLAKKYYLKKTGRTIQDWEAKAKKIKVISFGAANHVWPAELGDVKSHSIKNDFVIKASLKIAKLINFLGGKKNYKLVLPEESRDNMSLISAPHSLVSYIKTFYPRKTSTKKEKIIKEESTQIKQTTHVKESTQSKQPSHSKEPTD